MKTTPVRNPPLRALPRLACLRGAAILAIAAAAGTSAPAADPSTGLVVHLAFDDAGLGGMMFNKAGPRNGGRMTGAKWIPSGRGGGGCELGPTNACVVVTNSPALAPLKQVTVALWFKTAASTAAGRYIVEKGPEKGYALGIAGDSKEPGSRGKLRAVVNGRACLGDGVVTDGRWRHGAVTYDGQTLKLYMDGTLQKQTVTEAGPLVPNGKDLTIGMNRSNPAPQQREVAFDGVVDEIMLFDRALTEEDVKAVVALAKPRFTKDQVSRRLTELKELLDRGLLLPEFYDRKVKECEADL
jgi:hypothetical protein